MISVSNVRLYINMCVCAYIHIFSSKMPFESYIYILILSWKYLSILNYLNWVLNYFMSSILSKYSLCFLWHIYNLKFWPADINIWMILGSASNIYFSFLVIGHILFLSCKCYNFVHFFGTVFLIVWQKLCKRSIDNEIDVIFFP